MKSLIAILILTLSLGVLGFSSCFKKTTTGPKEEVVKARLVELFDLCKAGKVSDAASYIMYRGPDQSRSGKDVVRYSDESEKREADGTCARIRKGLAESPNYSFGKFMSQTKGDGSEVVGWEVYFQQGPMKTGEIYAFTLLDGKYVLVDIDPISGANERPSPSSSSSSSSDVPPPTVRDRIVGPSGPGSIPGPDAPPPPAPTPRKPPPIISGGVLNGRATSLPQPPYPPVAKAARASGTVTVQVTIDEEGKVISAHAVSGHPLLQAAAVAAAKQARFPPTKLSGQPVKVMGVVIYNFKAQ
ncbi:MAG: energy transducer TonB [Acidobacteriota bacterium]